VRYRTEHHNHAQLQGCHCTLTARVIAPLGVATPSFAENLLSEHVRLVTDAEVLQEILHRYAAIDRRDAIQPAFDAILGIVDQVLSIDLVAAERAKTIVLDRLGSRLATPCISRLWNSIPSAEF
jgi:hypothetical protein